MASNLPGVMQYLDLLRDAAWAVGIPGIPETVVETRNALTGEVYAEADARLQRHEVKSKPYVKKTDVANKEESEADSTEAPDKGQGDAGDKDKANDADDKDGAEGEIS